MQVNIAGTVLDVRENEAAVVVYCPSSWKGESIIIEINNEYSGIDKYKSYLFPSEMEAHVNGRPVGDKIIYAAIFPRIRFLTEKAINEGILQAICRVRKNYNAAESHSIYLGTVTEVDWSDK